MRIFIIITFLCCSLASWGKNQIKENQLHGHSHNDYKQDKPFVRAYEDGMESIEADVFLKEGKLFVAHEEKEIRPGRTLDVLYLQPLFQRYVANGGYPFADTSKSLQLVIDIKEHHQDVIPAIVRYLKPYMTMVRVEKARKPIHIVISGDMPKPAQFKNFPDFISFDGRPGIAYQPDELKRIAMVSVSMNVYSHWDGVEELSEADRAKMKAVVQTAKNMGKPFRFWATPDTEKAWTELAELGVTWLNTDHPDQLKKWLYP